MLNASCVHFLCFNTALNFTKLFQSHSSELGRAIVPICMDEETNPERLWRLPGVTAGGGRSWDPDPRPRL